MNKLNIIGNVFGSDGFTSHVRQLSNALYEQGFDVRIDCPKPHNWELTVNDAELLMLNKEFEEDYTSILIGQPQYLPMVYADNPEKTILFMIWEGETIPKYWVNYLLDKQLYQIWVPSEHVKQAILNTTDKDSIKNKIKVIPHGINSSLFTPKTITDKQPFTFICNKGWRGGMEDRGGMQYVLKAFNEEFTEKDDVQLKIKLNPSYLGGRDVNSLMEELGLEREGKAPILINSDNVLFEEIPNLYQGNVYVCATRAEGFNLPGLEAHSMGLPTIQTDYGGQIDYMTEETDYYINYELKEVDNDIQYEGIKWAVPDIKHLRELMRYCYENKKEVKQKGDLARKNIEQWTWSMSAKKIKEVLK